MFFEPTEQQASQLLADLCSAGYSLIDLAPKYSTTLEALSLWLSFPENQQRLATLEDSASGHVRLASTFSLNSCITALSKLIDEFNNTPPLFKKQEQGRAPQPRPSEEQINHHLRHNDLALKACSSLYRLSRFTAIPRRRPGPLHPALQSRGAQAPGAGRTSPPDPRFPPVRPVNPITPNTEPDPHRALAANSGNSNRSSTRPSQSLRSEIPDLEFSPPLPDDLRSEHPTSEIPDPASVASTAWP